MGDKLRLPDEAEFVDTYRGKGHTVTVNGRSAPFDWFVQMEEQMCGADESRRLDPARRIHKLAEVLGAEALTPEHRPLLELRFED